MDQEKLLASGLGSEGSGSATEGCRPGQFMESESVCVCCGYVVCLPNWKVSLVKAESLFLQHLKLLHTCVPGAHTQMHGKRPGCLGCSWKSSIAFEVRAQHLRTQGMS